MLLPARDTKPSDVQNMPDVHIHIVLSTQLGCGSLPETLSHMISRLKSDHIRSFLQFFSFLSFSLSYQFTTKVVINSQVTYQGHSNYVTSVAFFPDGTLVLTGSFDHTARLWERESGRLLVTYQGHSNYVTS